MFDDDRGDVRDSVVLERRETERYAITVDMSLTSEHQFFTALSGDLSRGGVFVSTYRPVPIGSAVEVTLRLPTGTVRATGIVRWTRELSSGARPGVGISFEDISPEARAALDTFCQVRPPLLVEIPDERVSRP